MISKVTKNQNFTISLENAVLEKPQADGQRGWRGRGELSAPSLFMVNDFRYSLFGRMYQYSTDKTFNFLS